MRRRKRHMRIVLLLFFVFGIFSYYRSNFTFRVTDYTVESPYLPNAFSGYKIVQISDLHNNAKIFEKLVEKVDEIKPDMIVLTGDLVSRNPGRMDNLYAFLKRLTKNTPVFYIKGNHEQGIEGDELVSDLSHLGVVYAGNKQVPIVRRMAKIVLCGLEEDPSFYAKGASPIPVSDYLGTKPLEYTILLAHNPIFMKDYMDWGADLTLSGHMHGGGVRLPFVGGIFSPDFTFFPKYDKGKFTEETNSMIVSGGLGNSVLPFRLFNPPELVVVTLASQSIR